MSLHHCLLPFLSIGILLCFQPSYAQNGSDISLSFVSFPKSSDPVKLKLRLAADKFLEIEAPSKWLSPSVRVASPGTWAVGETATGPDGKTVFKELGRTTASASPQQILLVIRKGKDDADGFDLITLDGRASGFGAGNYLFMNAAKVDIAGVIGEEKFVIKPNQHAIIQPKIPKGEHTIHTSLYFRKDNEARPFFSSEWRVSDDARNLIFFYHDPQTSHIRLHAIKDFIP